MALKVYGEVEIQVVEYFRTPAQIRNIVPKKSTGSNLGKWTKQSAPALMKGNFMLGEARVHPEEKVTVGIVVFNTELPIIQKTIESLQKSQGIKLRLHVHCNSENQNYRNQVLATTKLLGNTSYSEGLNQGFGAGHNEIFRRTSPNWYVCANPDVEVEPHTIKTLILFARSQPNGVLFGPKIIGFDGKTHPLARKHLTLKTWIHRQLWRLAPNLFAPYESKFDYEKTQEAEFVSGAFFLVASDNFKLLTGFDETFFVYSEDADISRRAAKLGQNYYVAESKVLHHWNAAWQKSGKALKLEIVSLVRYFYKHGL